MAAPRTQQAHQKRVQKIVDEAADKVAQSSPVDEEVLVTIEELPPEDERGARSSRAGAKTRQITEDAADTWFDLTTSAFEPLQLAGVVDPRTMIESSFRFWEELLAMQKDFALKLVDTIQVRR